MEKENKYYVYIYLDPRKPGKYYYPNMDVCFLFEPFYVGKGKNKQMYSHLKETKENTINKGNYILIYTKMSLIEVVFVS